MLDLFSSTVKSKYPNLDGNVVFGEVYLSNNKLGIIITDRTIINVIYKVIESLKEDSPFIEKFQPNDCFLEINNMNVVDMPTHRFKLKLTKLPRRFNVLVLRPSQTILDKFFVRIKKESEIEVKRKVRKVKNIYSDLDGQLIYGKINLEEENLGIIVRDEIIDFLTYKVIETITPESPFVETFKKHDCLLEMNKIKLRDMPRHRFNYKMSTLPHDTAFEVIALRPSEAIIATFHKRSKKNKNVFYLNRKVKNLNENVYSDLDGKLLRENINLKRNDFGVETKDVKIGKVNYKAVEKIKDSSPCKNILQENDLLLQINDRDMTNITEHLFRKKLKKLEKDSSFEILSLRPNPSLLNKIINGDDDESMSEEERFSYGKNIKMKNRMNEFSDLDGKVMCENINLKNRKLGVKIKDVIVDNTTYKAIESINEDSPFKDKLQPNDLLLEMDDINVTDTSTDNFKRNLGKLPKSSFFEIVTLRPNPTLLKKLAKEEQENDDFIPSNENSHRKKSKIDKWRTESKNLVSMLDGKVFYKNVELNDEKIGVKFKDVVIDGVSYKLVQNISRNSPFRDKLKRNDLLLEIDDVPVTDISTNRFKRNLGKLPNDSSFDFIALRPNPSLLNKFTKREGENEDDSLSDDEKLPQISEHGSKAKNRKILMTDLDGKLFHENINLNNKKLGLKLKDVNIDNVSYKLVESINQDSPFRNKIKPNDLLLEIDDNNVINTSIDDFKRNLSKLPKDSLFNIVTLRPNPSLLNKLGKGDVESDASNDSENISHNYVKNGKTEKQRIPNKNLYSDLDGQVIYENIDLNDRKLGIKIKDVIIDDVTYKMIERMHEDSPFKNKLKPNDLLLEIDDTKLIDVPVHRLRSKFSKLPDHFGVVALRPNDSRDTKVEESNSSETRKFKVDNDTLAKNQQLYSYLDGNLIYDNVSFDDIKNFGISFANKTIDNVDYKVITHVDEDSSFARKFKPNDILLEVDDLKVMDMPTNRMMSYLSNKTNSPLMVVGCRPNSALLEQLETNQFRASNMSSDVVLVDGEPGGKFSKFSKSMKMLFRRDSQIARAGTYRGRSIFRSRKYEILSVEVIKHKNKNAGFTIISGKKTYNEDFDSAFIHKIDPKIIYGNENQLQIGDKLVSINDIPMKNKTTEEIEQLLTSKKLNLKIKR